MRSVIGPLVVATVLLGAACTTTSEQDRTQQLNQFNDAAVINLELGVRYFQQGNFPVAEEKLQKSIGIDNKIPEAHNVLGVLYEETGRSTAALSSYRRAVELDSRFGLARVNYGRLLCAEGDYPQGIAQFRRVLDGRQMDDLASAYAELGACQLSAGDTDTARQSLAQALELNRTHAAALLAMARYELVTGDARSARSFLDRHHSAARESSESLWVAMEVEGASGNATARDAYELRLRTDFPDSREAEQLRIRSGKFGEVSQ